MPCDRYAGWDAAASPTALPSAWGQGRGPMPMVAEVSPPGMGGLQKLSKQHGGLGRTLVPPAPQRWFSYSGTPTQFWALAAAGCRPRAGAAPSSFPAHPSSRAAFGGGRGWGAAFSPQALPSSVTRGEGRASVGASQGRAPKLSGRGLPPDPAELPCSQRGAEAIICNSCIHFQDCFLAITGISLTGTPTTGLWDPGAAAPMLATQVLKNKSRGGKKKSPAGPPPSPIPEPGPAQPCGALPPLVRCPRSQHRRGFAGGCVIYPPAANPARHLPAPARPGRRSIRLFQGR